MKLDGHTDTDSCLAVLHWDHVRFSPAPIYLFA